MEVFSMSYSTTNTYQLKRGIVKFSKKICKDSNKPTSKFVTNMLYDIFKSKDILLSNIDEALDEDISKINTIDRLSNNLSFLTIAILPLIHLEITLFFLLMTVM